jgi:predicted AlkP superfamily phosphohydrolase/phosphomutase
MSKIVILGLDGFSPELVGLWADDLPNLMKMQAEGIWGNLQSTIPPTTPLAWTCAQTGVNPGHLGFWDFSFRSDFTYNQPEIINAGLIKSTPLYKYLSYKRAKKVAIINVPISWPPPEIPGGYAITDFTTPGLERGYTWPDSLKKEVTDLVGEYILDAYDRNANYLKLNKDLVLDKAYKMDEQRLVLIKHFIRNKKCDYILCVLMGINRLSHVFWRYFDKTHRRYENNEKYREVIRNHYKYVDTQIGEIRSLLDSDTAFLIHSAYSVQKLEGCINLNEWLIDQGYLVLQEYPKQPSKIKDLKINWDKTKAWAAGNNGQIYLNMQGRESRGIVPPSEYESLMKELREKIVKIPDEGGSLLKTRFLMRDDVHHGPLAKFGPDIFVFFNEGRWNTNEMIGYGKGNIYSYDTSLGPDDGSHGFYGYFCAVGPEVPAEGEKQGTNLLDIAPTVLSIMGEKVPDLMEGTSLVKTGKSSEEKKVYDRLSALGY